jgi:hypothetical protein
MLRNLINYPLHTGLKFIELHVGVVVPGQTSSDLSATGTSETETLDSLQPGDIVLPGAHIDVITPFVLAAGTLTFALGITGTVDRFIAATNIKDTTAKVLVNTTATHALPYINNTASAVSLIGTLTAGAGNVGDATAGHLRIIVPILRFADRISLVTQP